MLKIRVTFVDEDSKSINDIEKVLSVLEKDFQILNQSKVYKGRGTSKYSNIDIDIDRKE